MSIINVPQYLYLHSQSYNSQFIEYVWRFPSKEDEDDQVIFKVYKDNTFYLEYGKIGKSGDYANNIPTFFIDGASTEWLKNKDRKEIAYLKRFFTLEIELVKLAEDSVKYLKEI